MAWLGPQVGIARPQGNGELSDSLDDRLGGFPASLESAFESAVLEPVHRLSSISHHELMLNITAVARAATAYGLPVVLSTVGVSSG